MNQFNVQFARLKKSAQKWIDAPLPAVKTTSNSATVTPKPKSPKKSPVNIYNQDKIVAVGVNVPKCSLSYIDSENGNVFEQDIEEEIRLYEQALDRIRIRQQSLYAMEHLEDNTNEDNATFKKAKTNPRLEKWRERTKLTKKGFTFQRMGIMAEIRRLKAFSIKTALEKFSNIEQKALMACQ